MSKIFNFFRVLAKGWVISLLFGLFLFFIIILLPILNRIFPETANMVSLEAPTYYTLKESYSILDSWGEAGRNWQIIFHLTWDVIVPILSVLIFGLCFSWLFMRGFKITSKIQKLNLVAFGGIFDLLENICIIAMIQFYPTQVVVLVWLKNIFTLIKYSFLIVYGILLLIGLIYAVKNRFHIQKEIKIM
jgi:hypothetical protein